MKETKFIQQNKKKWSDFEKLRASETGDPELLSDLYLDITDDLSYAQTFYPKRTIRVYLNQLAQSVFVGLNKYKREPVKKLWQTWSVSLPLEVYRSRKQLQFALIAFIAYCLIGIISTHFYPNFPRIILGDLYVETTLANIKNGNPLAIYQSQEGFSMFLAITSNNLKVAFLTFFVGFFFTIGTHILLFSNGVMLGAFQYFFYLKGLLITSFLGIWIHGAFEISAIVLAGGAGLTAGSGWLFPKSYTRKQAMQLGAKRGIKIMFSLVPFIVAAGFLESYVTRNYQSLPEWSKWFLIFFSFGFILFVYVLYPIYIARKYPELVANENPEVIETPYQPNVYELRNGGEVIAESVQFFGKIFNSIFKKLLLIIPLIFIIFIVQNANHLDEMNKQYYFDWAYQLAFVFGFTFSNLTDVIILIGWSFILSYIIIAVFYHFHLADISIKTKLTYFQFIKKRFLAVWFGFILLYSFTMILPWYLLIFAFFLFPFLYLQTPIMGLDQSSLKSRFKKMFKFKGYGISFLILIISLVIVFLIAQPFSLIFSIQEKYQSQPMISDLLDLLSKFVERIVNSMDGNGLFWANVTRQLFYTFFTLLVTVFVAITMGFAYFSLKEKEDATSLKVKFEKFGRRKRNQETLYDYE